MTRLAAFALIPALATSPALAAQTTPTPIVAVAPVAAAPVVSDDADAHETRIRLMEILRGLPPAIREVLRHDPSLLGRADYLTPYPKLAAFLTQHPEVLRSPAFFFGTPLTDDGDPGSRAMRMSQDVMEGVGGFIFFLSFAAFLAWIVRTVIDYRRWLRLSKVQVEVHSKLLDRMSSHDDLLAYIQSPSGRRFLDSAPIELDGQPRPTTAALTRVIWSVQAGVVLTAVGLGFWWLGRNVLTDAAQGFSVISTLALALGMGFIVSAGVSYLISTRHGLIGAEARAQHE